MKKLLSIALAAAMTLSLGAMAVSADEAPADSMNVNYYKYRDTVNFIGDNGVLTEDNRSDRVGYDNLKQFDDTINDLLEGSIVAATEEDQTSVSILSDIGDWYIYEWKGTMTAKESGTYTLIARQIDNGFVMKVDGDKVFEYWGASHWFDGTDKRLVSDEGTFTVEAGKSYDVELYYLELDGGDRLEVFATTTPEDTNSGKNIDEAFTFDLTKKTYNGDRAGKLNSMVGIGDGVDGDNRGGNDGLIVDTNGNYVEDNRRFDVAILDELEAWTDASLPTTVSKFNENLPNEDAYIIKYTGSLTPAVTGTYTFGAYKIDNGFYLEIDGKPVYEFWAGWTWNDSGATNYDPTGIELEAGKSYNFTAYFLETNGGQALDMRYAVDAADGASVADMAAIEEGFVFSTETVTDNNQDGNEEPKTDVPKTGDAVVYSVAAAVAVLSLGAVVVSKKRRITE